MGNCDQILNKYPLSDVDRRIAADIAEKMGHDPRFADRFEGYSLSMRTTPRNGVPAR
jgi:hypothetical protein